MSSVHEALEAFLRPALPGYQLEGLLGAGAQGRVHAARAPDGTPVAIKHWPDLDPSTLRGARAAREARALAAVDHPAVVRFVALHPDARGRPCLVTERVEGPTLREVLATRTRLAPCELRALGVTLAGGLAALHARGLVHRDLKPANVILRAPAHRPVLVDLGLVHEAAATRITGDRQPGTSPYQSPEQLAGRIGPACDVYALGVLLYEAAIGALPWEGGQGKTRFERARRDPLRDPRSSLDAAGLAALAALPAWLRGPLARCLAPEPNARPSAMELAARLRARPDPRGSTQPPARQPDPRADTQSLPPVPGRTPSKAARPSDRLPRALGRYELRRQLAAGGMGRVYRAYHPGLRREVALKVILPERSRDPDTRRRFLREAQLAARLEHPHIVGVHDVGEEAGQLYLVMDLVEGGGLADKLLREGPLPVRRAAELARDLALALAYAHERGVIHRDVKPGNILLTPAGTARLTDFGLSRDLQDQRGMTRAGQVLGTPAYMAPEQARGAGREADPRTDVYGLGATLYEMLTGRPPFAEADVNATLKRVRGGDLDPPSTWRPGLPAELERICLRCLAKDPAQRYASAVVLAADVNRFLSQSAADARAGPPRSQSRSSRSKGAPGRTRPRFRVTRRALIAGSALLCVLLGISMAVTRHEHRRARDLARTLAQAEQPQVQASREAARLRRANEALHTQLRLRTEEAGGLSAQLDQRERELTDLRETLAAHDETAKRQQRAFAGMRRQAIEQRQLITDLRRAVAQRDAMLADQGTVEPSGGSRREAASRAPGR